MSLLLVACGGGGESTGIIQVPQGSTSGWVSGQFLPASTFAGRCAAPRTGTDPTTSQPYTDVLGSTLTENNWLRSWSNDLYLWYDEIVDRDPAGYATDAYFGLLKTTELTASGTSKDQFHFSYPTTEWLALSQSGMSSGYGAEWAVVQAIPPRRVVVAYLQPNSPATEPSANLKRGEEVLAVDGVDVVSADTEARVDLFVAGLYPSQPGERHQFVVRDASGNTRTIVMESATVTSAPVLNVKTIATSAGKVGYMQFNDHLATAEQALVTAVDTLRAEAIDDLVIDIRYNGGGYLAIASQLAYMIAGTVPTAGQTFEKLEFNDKHPSIDPVTGAALQPFPFIDQTVGFSAGLAAGQPLPTLDLPRVFVLTGGSTCSASESIINSLRGVNVEVIQIGSTTCGKPYGFYPADNCGTTYFTIEFRGVNAVGFGDYTDGFAPANTPGTVGTRIPGCAVADDFLHELGDPTEARLSAALGYQQFGPTCPVATSSKPRLLSKLGGAVWESTDALVPKSPWLENRSLVRP